MSGNTVTQRQNQDASAGEGQKGKEAVASKSAKRPAIMNVIFWAFTIAILGLGFYHLSTLYNLRYDKKYAEWKLYPLSDLYTCLYSLLILGVTISISVVINAT